MTVIAALTCAGAGAVASDRMREDATTKERALDAPKTFKFVDEERQVVGAICGQLDFKGERLATYLHNAMPKLCEDASSSLAALAAALGAMLRERDQVPDGNSLDVLLVAAKDLGRTGEGEIWQVNIPKAGAKEQVSKIPGSWIMLGSCGQDEAWKPAKDKGWDPTTIEGVLSEVIASAITHATEKNPDAVCGGVPSVEVITFG